jgi:hypothetical protein
MAKKLTEDQIKARFPFPAEGESLVSFLDRTWGVTYHEQSHKQAILRYSLLALERICGALGRLSSPDVAVALDRNSAAIEKLADVLLRSERQSERQP